MLTVLQGLDQAARGDVSPEERETLEQTRIRVEGAGLPADLDGEQLLRLLRSLRQAELDPAQARALEEARFTFEGEGGSTTVTGAELGEAARQLHQSNLIGNLLAFDGPVVPDRRAINPRYTYMLLFILVMIVLWFGCNNAAKEIVKEEAVYGRERAVNLGITPYLASKFLVLSAITALHALMLMVIVYGSLEALQALVPGSSAPPPLYRLDYLPQFGVLVLLAMSGVALGLLLSACVATPDRANALLPYVLIPQLILGGGILGVSGGPLYYLAVSLSPVYWAYRAVHLRADTLPPAYPGHVDYPDGVGLPCAALILQTVLMLALTAWALRRKEV
jgi:hypothetical protein